LGLNCFDFHIEEEEEEEEEEERLLFTMSIYSHIMQEYKKYTKKG